MSPRFERRSSGPSRDGRSGPGGSGSGRPPGGRPPSGRPSAGRSSVGRSGNGRPMPSNRRSDGGRSPYAKPGRDGSSFRDRRAPRDEGWERPRGGDRPGNRSDDRPRERFGDRPGNRSGDRPRERFGDRPGNRSDDRPRERFGDRSRSFDRDQNAFRTESQNDRSGPGRFRDRNDRYGDRRRSGDERRQPSQRPRSRYDNGRSQRLDAAPEAAAATPPADDLIWGRHATQAALEAGRPIHRIWCTPEMRSAAKFLQLLRDAKASGVLVEEVTWARLGQITGGSVHQGIALQTAAAETLDLETLIDGCSDLGEPPLLVALDSVTDPHNLGAVVRSAEAMGAHGVVIPQRRSAGLTGSAAKVAAGALEHLPVARVVNLNRSLEKLKDAGYRVVGLAAEGDVTLTDVDLSGPLVLVTGSEDQGLSLLTRRHCDQLVRIPLRGITPSLNASVATALCVYEVARRNWMKDIHGQAPSPPIRRPQLAGVETSTEASEPPEQPVEKVPDQRIELDLHPSEQAAAPEFDQNIQLSP
ncbi:23S rRNA (guanosine(2251)-2'-O)-methyltransferase RlmB [Synechococcus sp. MU1625]|uniref:23S rRNA (guanosine(2251)-2'-O)-methyltransferase RlmB n=1 Tax=Synechococcus sp. MU1625 TaxID=2508347 RepID=UPI001CF8EBE5|nr:23S rRNA (guanosine(2251)-2'-O)-methyltransferase RlmB [Synechococcus sp. MU1625]MCB4398747.1 23S rRNA (guanosine(2251)-2'-O)-methyltransferase RlmB [Synechococcus sp. MU1625]